MSRISGWFLASAVGLVCPGLTGAGEIVFVEKTKEAGLLEPLAGLMGHGGAWGDYDGDGWIDLYVGGFCDRPNAEYAPAKGPVPNHLFRNRGDGTFVRVKSPPLEMFARTSGAVFADLDNDGTLELYVSNNARERSRRASEPQRSAQLARSRLFHYTGKKWVDVSEGSGACPKRLRSARNVGVFDYDNDGLLDLLVIEDRFIPGPRTALFHNKGGLRFEDVTERAGLPEDLYGLGVAVADVNEDGRPDFFVPHSNRLFVSTGKERYREVTGLRELFAHHPVHPEDWPCGAAFADVNRDGRPDLVVSNHYERARNRLFLHEGVREGVPRFREVTKEAGLGDIVPTKCPHVEFQDFDNDGWPDLYVSAGWLEKGKFTPLIYRHQGLEDGVPHFAPPRPVKGEMVYFPAGPSGDYDRDGRVDLFLINWFKGNHSRLMHNESRKKRWLDVRVVGKRMNRMGVGARVCVYRAGRAGVAEGLLGCREVSTGYGYASGQPAVCHFGLDRAETVDVEVHFPGGGMVTRRRVETNQILKVEEPSP
jgi:hypothetical protein